MLHPAHDTRCNTEDMSVSWYLLRNMGSLVLRAAAFKTQTWRTVAPLQPLKYTLALALVHAFMGIMLALAEYMVYFLYD